MARAVSRDKAFENGRYWFPGVPAALKSSFSPGARCENLRVAANADLGLCRSFQTALQVVDIVVRVVRSALDIFRFQDLKRLEGFHGRLFARERCRKNGLQDRGLECGIVQQLVLDMLAERRCKNRDPPNIRRVHRIEDVKDDVPPGAIIRIILAFDGNPGQALLKEIADRPAVFVLVDALVKPLNLVCILNETMRRCQAEFRAGRNPVAATHSRGMYSRMPVTSP